MSASALWTAVKARYDLDGLVPLTNIRDRSATAVDDTVGEQAAQDTIDSWPLYVQEPYDASNSQHVLVAVQGVIAVLWERGGSSTSIAEVKWDAVFVGPDSLAGRLKNVGPRGRMKPNTNSGVRQSRETLPDGSRVRPWSDREHFTDNLPSRRGANGDT